MIPTTLREPPLTVDYIPLAQHQEATPTVFFDGKPVLHYEARNVTATLPRCQCNGTLPMFPGDAGAAEASDSALAGEVPVEKTVDVFVSSENLVLFSAEHEAGIAVPYPAIAIHAIQTLDRHGQKVPVVWMQLELWDNDTVDYEENDPIELTLTLPAAPSSTETDAYKTPLDDTADGTATPTPKPIRERLQALYSAITACAELHPDPADIDSEVDEFDRFIFEGGGRQIDGLPGAWEIGDSANGLPPPMPGSGGWITADNVHEFFDEEGNWIEQGEGEDMDEGADDNKEDEQDIAGEQDIVGETIVGELGEGAGRVRDRDEVEREERKASDTVEEAKDEIEAKKPRIE